MTRASDIELHYVQLNVTAKPGQDVTLTCTAAVRNISVVEWARADLATQYVVLYRGVQRSDGQYQHSFSENRVVIKDQNLRDGDASVILKGARISDTGTYKCDVSTPGLKVITVIHLSVVDPPGK